MDIVWHRGDLRTADNTALAHSDTAIPVYIFDTNMLENGSARRVAWLRENVKWLRDWYADHGSDLIVRHGDPRDIIPSLAVSHEASRVLWNKSYSQIGQSRDEAVEKVLSQNMIATEQFHDKGMQPPGTIFTNKGEPYSVFSYYHKKWKKRDKDLPRPTPTADELADIDDTGSIPTLSELGFEPIDIGMPKPGTEAARNLLSVFSDNSIFRYGDERDYPSENSTSRLSAYLAYGIIGIREVWQETVRAESKVSGEKLENVDEFRQELAWRDFYTQVLYHNPRVVTENYKDYENTIQWSDNTEHLTAWQDGQTGYPIVDAGMRQLKQTGYMHNRLRMIVASFLTKDLLIDWREGYHWFRKMLFDHDTANNNGGWQWAASTGTDAQPYFRIFNPMTQGERYDQSATYIKRYIPELEDVPAEKIHEWDELSSGERKALAPDYPDPIVDHSEQRDKALSMYKSARGDD